MAGGNKENSALIAERSYKKFFFLHELQASIRALKRLFV